MPTTSLRLGVGESNSLTIQAKAKAKAKEKITLLSPNTLLQVHGEIDTATFSPSFLSIDARYIYPELSASIGVGVQLKKDHEHSYYVRWKKVFPLIIDCTSVKIKGSCYVNKDFRESKASGVVKLAWDVPNNQNKKDRMNQKKKDRMMKIGFDILKKVPYLQVKENNWTLNADMAGKWNLRLDL